MSWNNIGAPTDLAPGQSVTWTYSWDKGQDMGLQLAGPNGMAVPGFLGTAVASNQGKAVIGFNDVFYVVTITNVSSQEHVLHNLQGGGVS